MTHPRKLLAGALLLQATLSVFAASNVTTVAELRRQFYPGEDHSVVFSLTGTVTHITQPAEMTGYCSFVFRDRTGTVQFFQQPFTPPVAGSMVVIRGHTTITSSGEPWTSEKVSMTSIGFEALPTPRQVALAELDAPEMDLQTVCVRGTVIDVFPDDMGPGYDFILLKEKRTVVPVVCQHDPDLHKLIDSQACVTGLVQHALSSYRKFTSPFIFIDRPTDIVQVTPPPSDPFAFPPLPLDLYVSPQRLATLGKHSITGIVLAAWLPNNVMIQTGLDRIVCLTLCKGEKLPEINVPCTAVGHPVSDTYHVNLMQARVRVDGKQTSAKEVGKTATPESILLDEHGAPSVKASYHGQLISLTGVIQSMPVSDADKRQLLLNCGKIIVPVDFSACPDDVRAIPLGSTIEVTGRCVLEIAPWQPSDVLPRITGILLVIRHADDLRVLTLPPWLTVSKTLIIAAVLLLALLAVFVRNCILRRISRLRLAERTQLAVELHDSLSQSLAGIAYQITAAQRDDDRQTADRKLVTADQMLQSCRAELKNCLFDLRNDTIAERSFDRAIRRTIEKFDDQADLSVRFNVNRATFSDATVHSVLAIIRELVSNAVTHGHAWTVRIAGTVDNGKLMFSVKDDGEGFDPKTAPGTADGHFGLDGIRDRIKRLNGEFAINPALPRGTKAVITLPVK